MDFIRTLLDRQPPLAAPPLPEDLRKLYDGDLQFAAAAGRPYIIANFAATLDGVVSYKIPGKSGGAEITGRNSGDHFIMGLLRASADAVLVGAGTFGEVSPSHLWIPEYICPEAARLYECYRGKRVKNPLNVVVTGSGNVDVTRAIFHTPGVAALIITTAGGKQRIDQACTAAHCSVQVRAINNSDAPIAPGKMIELLFREFGIRRLLHEGGPALFGQFLQEHLIDELFLTLAPQIAGRNSTNDRPAFVRNAAFNPADAPWLNLLSVKQSGGYLYLRYRAPGNSD
jgi:riboflavin biosynthesis pyrimidine reductase